MPVHVMSTRKILRPWINLFTLPQKAAQNLSKPIKIGATQLRSVTKKSRRDNLSFYVWTKALSGMFFVLAQELSAIVKTSSIFNLMNRERNIVGQQFPTMMLHAASVSTFSCMLLGVAVRTFETSQNVSNVQTNATTPCWELLANNVASVCTGL